MERHPNRESVIELYLRDHLGTDRARISENPSTLGIVFCIDDERGRLQHRLEVRCEVIAGHGAQELENILDAQRVIETMREAGTESVVVSTEGGTLAPKRQRPHRAGRACRGEGWKNPENRTSRNAETPCRRERPNPSEPLSSARDTLKTSRTHLDV